MTKNRMVLLAFSLLSMASGPAMAGDPEIVSIQAKLFYEHTGTLSDDLIATKPSLWNTIIGEGDAKEPANSFLVIVEVKGDPDSFADHTLRLTAVLADGDNSGKTVAEQTFNGLLISPEGRTVKAMMVDNAVCSTININATLGKATKTETIPFACGE